MNGNKTLEGEAYAKRYGTRSTFLSVMCIVSERLYRANANSLVHILTHFLRGLPAHIMTFKNGHW